jgi:hypothetical protein
VSIGKDPNAYHHGGTSADRGRPNQRLRELQRGTTIEAALAFYDSLEAVGLAQMIGAWCGEDLPTDHPLDGLLEHLGWHGKRFDGPDDAHPLIFDTRGGHRFCVNPAFVPLGLIRHPRLLHAPFAARIFSVIHPLTSTRKPKARLRLSQYRGVVTATMCYDALPINDVFRKVDDDTLIGAMDLRGLDPPFLFVLRREEPVPSNALTRRMGRARWRP